MTVYDFADRMSHGDKSRFAAAAISTVAVLIAVGVYWRTAFPTISWWENGELTAAAGVLGIVHPPGALIPTIIGWLALRLPFSGSPAHWLNLVAGIVAGLVMLLTILASCRLLERTNTEALWYASGNQYRLVMALAGLTLAFSRTFWSNGTLFTPYIFTVLITVGILLALLKWWRDADDETAWRWMLVIMLLFGLDVSVHRTNLLLLPGVAFWALMRKPPVFRQWRQWAAGASGLALGSSVHLFLLPMAQCHPALNSNNPSTLSGWWNYVSLKQYGGGFLVSFWPRKSEFWSVQVSDYITGFRGSFATIDGPLGLLGLIPLLLGFIGLVALWRHRKRLALGMLGLFLLTSLGAIIYFNLPANYFRAMDRHYLPSFVLFGVLIIYGSVSLAATASRQRARLALLAVSLVVTLGIAVQITCNWPRLDNSRTYFACDCGQNLLNSLPQQSVLITGTDVDTYPLWYLQMVEHARPDVTVANVSLLNTPWYVAQLLETQPTVGLSMTPEEIAAHGFHEWRDTIIAIPGPGSDAAASTSVTDPDTLYLHVPPTVQGSHIFGHDDIVLRLIEANWWRRPIYFTSFALQQLGWLQPYLRAEGLVHRLMPMENPPLDMSLLIANLMTNYSSRGYTDSSIILEPPTRWVAYAAYSSFLTLAKALPDKTRCEQLKAQMLGRIPLERIEAPEGLLKGLEAACAGGQSESR